MSFFSLNVLPECAGLFVACRRPYPWDNRVFLHLLLHMLLISFTAKSPTDRVSGPVTSFPSTFLVSNLLSLLVSSEILNHDAYFTINYSLSLCILLIIIYISLIAKVYFAVIPQLLKYRRDVLLTYVLSHNIP